MDNFEENLEQTLKDILNKHSVDTLELFKKRFVDICISQCEGAKFGRKKGEYEAYKRVGRELDMLIFLLKTKK